MNLYGYVGNDPINGTDPSGLEKATLTRDEFSFTIETDLGRDQLDDIQNELPDEVFRQLNGRDLSNFDPGEVGLSESHGGNITAKFDGSKYGKNSKHFTERERIRIAAQISMGINASTVGSIEQDEVKTYVYTPNVARSEWHGPVVTIGSDAFSGDIQNLIYHVHHERYHDKYGTWQHRAMASVLYNELSALGFSDQVLCNVNNKPSQCKR